MESSFLFVYQPFQLQLFWSDVEKNAKRFRWRKSHSKIEADDEFGLAMQRKESWRACLYYITKPNENLIWKSVTSELVDRASSSFFINGICQGCLSLFADGCRPQVFVVVFPCLCYTRDVGNLSELIVVRNAQSPVCCCTRHICPLCSRLVSVCFRVVLCWALCIATSES